MKSHTIVRPSDSPLVHAVTQWTIGDDPGPTAFPDGMWDLVIYERDGRRTIIVTGQTTSAVQLPFSPGDKILTISFKPGTYLSRMPGSLLLNRAEVLPTTGARFALSSDSMEIPQFESADDLVKRLQKNGVIESDPLVSSYFTENPMAASVRTVQRHFLFVTGMSPRSFALIERARRAVALLQAGVPPGEVAASENYADQAHLTRSLKAIMGQTPLQLQRASAGLSKR